MRKHIVEVTLEDSETSVEDVIKVLGKAGYSVADYKSN
jgi:hypothetical protein